ncbi:MAG: hypothetical protein CVU44_17680 [Chloroflexi bacterium HGW-Chloroflexi-6]|nr:MAG: hypothetical protein CVU44_17680 [Chloroflexi bacterium HGW-Chloroflexi-6]
MTRSVRFLLVLSVLVLASLACQALAVGSEATPEPAAPMEEESLPEAPEPTQEQEVEEPSEAEESAPSADLGFETEFPVPDDASNGYDLGGGMISFQTSLSIEESLAFYRDSFAAEGYTEREINTAITDTTFSIVFDGHESGKAIVIQAVDLGSGSVNVTIRFEDM